MATTLNLILHLGMTATGHPCTLNADISKSPVKYTGNGLSHVAHLNAVHGNDTSVKAVL